jgi:hypothetical protein
VRRLTDSGCNKIAKGSWPGLEGKFTPIEPLDVDFDKEFEAARRYMRIIVATALAGKDL